MRLIFSLIFLICFVNNALASVTLGFNGEEAASVGIYVKDITSGEVIAANDENRALLPASVMKAITAATVFSSLDYDFRFETKVYLTAAVNNGVCNGNLVIESCGDPTIDSENFKDSPTFASEIVQALNERGVNKINGKVIVKQSMSDTGCIPEWEIDDVAWAYGAGFFGFNYRDNVFNLWPATKKTSPKVDDLNVTVKPGRSNDLIRGINSDNLLVYGTKVNDRSWRVTTTMNDPARTFCADLTSQLKSKGIAVESKNIEADNHTLILTHQSPDLSQILYETMVYSHNLFAEGMLRTLSSGGTRKQAIEREYKTWADRGISPQYNKILDGSGLSRADRLRPVFIGNVLEWMAKSDYANEYVSFFPKVGVDGTVKSLLAKTPLEGKLALKSGSMNAVQCFAGYKLNDEGRPTHVVVILVNAFYCDRAMVRTAIENFLLNTFQN